MQASRSSSAQASPPSRRSGGKMDVRSDDQLKAALSDSLKTWDKYLALVSLPHAAALGAFISRYDVAKDQVFFISFPTFMVSVTAWLFIVDMRLRDEFLQEHPDVKVKVPAIVRHFVLFLYPAALIFGADKLSLQVDRVALGLICLTLMSWLFCVILASSYLHWSVMRRARDSS